MRVNLLRKAVLMKEHVFAQSHCTGKRIACSEKMVYIYGLADFEGAANYRPKLAPSNQPRCPIGVYS